MSQPEVGRVVAVPAVATESYGRTGVEVVGRLGRARFPDLCVRCAGPAGRILPVTKLFWHESSEDSGYYYTARVGVPVCAGCLRAHQDEVRPIPPEVRRKLLRQWLVAALPYLFPLGVNLFVISILGSNLLQALAEPDDPTEILVWGAAVGVFTLLALMFLRLIYIPGRSLILDPMSAVSRYVQVERGPLWSRFIVPAEPTSTLRALDFSDDRSELFERERHLYTFEHPEVGSQFAELNADREWDPASPGAIRAHAMRRLLLAVVVLAVLYFVLKDLFN